MNVYLLYKSNKSISHNTLFSIATHSGEFINHYIEFHSHIFNIKIMMIIRAYWTLSLKQHVSDCLLLQQWGITSGETYRAYTVAEKPRLRGSISVDNVKIRINLK